MLSAADNQKAKELIMPLIFQPLLEDLLKGYSSNPKRAPFGGDDTVVNIISRELAQRFAAL